MNIKNIKTKGFRGFVDEKEFELSSPITILFGENGKGKSSVLNAIEWCLFGKESTGQNTGIRERIDWEIKNRVSRECYVELEMEVSEKPYILKRTWKSKSKDEITLQSKDNEESFTGQEAERKLDELLNHFTFKDFLSSVYQHQEVIRFILTQEPKDRNEAMDRLLGLSDYRNIIAGIDLSKIKPDTLENEIDGLREQIKARIDGLQKQIDTSQQELNDIGIKEEQISNDGIISFGNEINKRILTFISELQLQSSDEFKQLSPSDREVFLYTCKNEITKLRTEMPGIEKQKKIHEEILELNLSLEEYKRLKEKYTDKESELNKFIKINGSLENLSEKEKKIENEIKTKEQEKEKVSLLGTIIKNSIDYLTESPVEKDKCPVCGSVKDNLLENLQKKYEEKFKEEIGILEKEIKEKKYEKEKIRELKGKAMQFMEEYNRAKQEIEKKGKEIREKHNIPDREDIEKYLNAKINELNGNEEELKTKIDEKQKVLTEIENEIEKFRKIRDILKLKEQIKKSCEIETTDKWNALQKKSDELKKFYEKLQTIVEAVKTASKEEAQSKINSIGDKVSEYFKFMTQHPGIDKLELKVQRDVRTGTNSYSFEDSRGENVTS
ncbi:MAG TPA: AAA family ATPase, partial [bacterium]|nr:AAA family ATPase [bacterium]